MEDEAIAAALSNANKRTQTYYSRGAVRKPGESAEQQAARKTKLAQQRSKNGKAVRAARGLKKRGSKVGSKHRGRKLKILDPEEPGISTTEKTIRKALRDASPLLRKSYRLGEKRIPGETAEQHEARRVDAETCAAAPRGRKPIRTPKAPRKPGIPQKGRSFKILDPEEPGISTIEKTIRAAIRGAHSGLRKKYRLGEKRIPGETAEQQEARRVDAETYVFPHKAKATRKAAKVDDTMEQQEEEEDGEE